MEDIDTGGIDMGDIDMGDIDTRAAYGARRALRGIALRTPLARAESLSGPAREVRLKLETVQPTGSFKIRGAANALASLDAQRLARGVACASTGNHGRAVAFAASRMGVRAVVCMSELVPANKVEAIRGLGAETVIVGRSQDDAQREVRRLVEREGLAEIPPFDHPAVIAGQATIGLEIVEDWPEVDTVLVPLSGGGLISGIALALKSASPDIRVIGVSMARGAAMHESLKAGKPVEVTELPSLADSLGGGIGLNNRYSFETVRRLVDGTVLLDEARIAAAMRHLFLHEGQVAEGAGAVGVGALLGDLSPLVGERVCVVVSGRNVDMDLYRRVIDGASPFDDPMERDV